MTMTAWTMLLIKLMYILMVMPMLLELPGPVHRHDMPGSPGQGRRSNLPVPGRSRRRRWPRGGEEGEGDGDKEDVSDNNEDASDDDKKPFMMPRLPVLVTYSPT